MWSVLSNVALEVAIVLGKVSLLSLDDPLDWRLSDDSGVIMHRRFDFGHYSLQANLSLLAKDHVISDCKKCSAWNYKEFHWGNADERIDTLHPSIDIWKRLAIANKGRLAIHDIEWTKSAPVVYTKLPKKKAHELAAASVLHQAECSLSVANISFVGSSCQT